MRLGLCGKKGIADVMVSWFVWLTSNQICIMNSKFMCQHGLLGCWVGEHVRGHMVSPFLTVHNKHFAFATTGMTNE